MDDSKDLIDRLCTLAGTIMEDAAAEAISIGANRDRLELKIGRIRSSAMDAATVADAAMVVLRRSVEV